MRLRVIAGRQRQTGRAAFLRGPVLYALNPVLNGGGHASEAEAKSHELTAEEQLHALYMRCFLNSPKLLLLVDPYAAASDQMLEMIPELVRKCQKRGTGVLVLTEQSWIASGQPVFYLDNLFKN